MRINITDLISFRKFHDFLTKHGYIPASNITLKSIPFWEDGGVVTFGETGKSKWFNWWSKTLSDNHLSFPKDLDKILESLNLKEQYYKDNKQEVKMKYNYTVTPDSIVIFAGAKPYIARKDHLNFEKIKSLVKGKQFEKAVKLFDIAGAITANSKGKITVKNSVVYWNDKPLHNYVTNRLLTLLKEGFDVKPVINFLEDLYNNNLLVKENPNHYLVEDLYKFLQSNELPHTPDGGFLAWKRVRKDYLDIHSGTISYKVGESVKEPWEKVSKNRSECGGSGLYFGSRRYFEKLDFGAEKGYKLLLVKVMPRHVASVPVSYEHSKGRACELFVYAEYDDNSEIDLNKALIEKVDKNTPKRDKLGRFSKN